MVLRSVAPVTIGRPVLTGGAVLTVAVAALARLPAAVGVGGGDEHAHGRADVGRDELVARAGRARDVHPARAVGRALPLVGVGVAVPAPGARRRGQGRRRAARVPEIAGATVLTGPSPVTVAVALLAWLGAALRVRRGHEHAHRRADVGDRERVRRARRAGDVLPARAVARALPLVGGGVADRRSRCRSCRSTSTRARAVPVIVGLPVLTGAALGTVAVGVLAAVAVPSGLVAVTTTRTRRADVGDGQLVAGARRARDVRPGRAVARALPLVGVGVADAAPGAGGRDQRGAALGGAGERRPGGVDRRGADDLGGRRAGGGRRCRPGW